MERKFAWLIEFNINVAPGNPDPINFWSGDGLLNYQSKIYNGVGKVIKVSPEEVKTGLPLNRFKITMWAEDPTVRSLLLQDFGPYEIIFKRIYSDDNMRT